MKVAGYVRVAANELRDEATIETQIRAIRKKCSRQGHELVAIFCDEGESGQTPLEARPQGALLLQSAKRAEFEAVLVYALDRLADNLYVKEKLYYDLFCKSRILLFDADENTGFFEAVGRFLSSLVSSPASIDWSENTPQLLDDISPLPLGEIRRRQRPLTTTSKSS